MWRLTADGAILTTRRPGKYLVCLRFPRAAGFDAESALAGNHHDRSA
jgi:hypothetical protein